MITVSQYPSDVVRLELSGSVRSTDGKINIHSVAGGGTSAPVEIVRIGASFPPYTLSASDISRIFAESGLTYGGITRAEVEQDGLPAGSYEICFKLYDRRDQSLVGEFCSSPFVIEAVEPVVSQTVQVLPPYTNDLPGYFSSSRVNSVITVTQYPKAEARLRVRGIVRSSDGSLSISRPVSSVEPLHGVTIRRSGGVYPPLTLTSADYYYIFEESCLEYSGITREEVARDGLPGGSYQVCFELYDEGQTTMLASTCSSPFTIGSVPPVINQTVRVLPPYTNVLSDYFAGGKISSVINVTQYAGTAARLELFGSIRSTDGGIDIRPGANAPGASVEIVRNDWGYPPYTLTPTDVSNAFREPYLVYGGITREEVERNGLPAGSYEICFKLYDRRDQSLVGEFCSSPFTIEAVAPVVSQTVQVLPPYTNVLSDYFGVGKISSVITVSQYPTSSAVLGVRGIIRSTDGGIEIGSMVTSNHPLHRVTITKGAGGYPPYTLTSGDYAAIFSEGRLEYRGITREEVEQNGLPAGSYQVCFELYDEGQVTQLTSTCSSPFTIAGGVLPEGMDIEPPVIILPLDGAEIAVGQAPALQFSWTMPSGAPVETQYMLKIIEVSDSEANYRDMLRDEGYAAFFETDAGTATTYLYTAANLALLPDRAYAFVVRAVDPHNQVRFRNDGYSEPVVFKAKAYILPDVEHINDVKPKIDDVQLSFVSPRYSENAPDTLTVNENENLILAWRWVSRDVSRAKQPQTVDQSEVIKERKIAAYTLTVQEIDANSGRVIKTLFTKDFRREQLNTASKAGDQNRFNTALTLQSSVTKVSDLVRKDTIYHITIVR